MFRWCCQTVPNPDPPQTFPRWVFKHGTVVNAASKSAACTFINDVQTHCYYATETEPGIWDVQFDEYITVENIEAKTLTEAVQRAKYFLMIDSQQKKFLFSD